MDSGKIKQLFGVRSIEYHALDNVTRQCISAYKGFPDWVDTDDHIRTVNFTKAICEETARLAMLATKINVGESPRAKYIQEKIDVAYPHIRAWVEYAFAYGSIVLKPNGTDIDVMYPDDYAITSVTNGVVDGIVFQYNQEVYRSGEVRRWYRYEYHRFEGKGDYRRYVITNKCFDGEGSEVSIDATPWEGIAEEVTIGNIEKPLFAIITTPHANGLDENCPLSTPICANALEELRDLDVAYSRNAWEVENSKRIILLDSDRLLPGAGGRITEHNKVYQMDVARRNMGLPDYVRAVEGDTGANIYNEINPSLNTSVREVAIDALLSQIGYKVGFANGYFVFNQSMRIQTATGVEANQQRTIQFIKDCRDRIETALNTLVYALDVMVGEYEEAPEGEIDPVFDFGDITYNRDEDRARWFSYVSAGLVPAWKFFEKFEGMTEEEAKEMVNEATSAKMDLMSAFEQ